MNLASTIKKKSILIQLIPYLSLIIILICAANILMQYLGGGVIRQHLLNSDTLFLPTLLSDLLQKGGQVSDWSVPPSPYFFPDLTLFFIFFVIGLKPYMQLVAMAFIQMLFVSLAVWLIAKNTRNQHPLFSSALSVAILTYFALAVNKSFDFVSGGPFVLMLVSVFHFGIFITSLFFIYCWLNSFDNFYGSNIDSTTKKRYLNLLAAATLAFLSSISDSFFIIQTIVPLVALTFVRACLEHRSFKRIFNLPLVVVLIASAAGLVSGNFLGFVTTRPQPHLGLDGYAQRLQSIIDVFVSLVTVYPVFLVIFFCYLAIVTVSTYRFFTDIRNLNKFDWLSVFSLISILSTIAALLTLQNIPTIGARYLIPLFFWPVIVLSMLIGNGLRKWHHPFALLISVPLTILVSFNSYALIQSKKLDLDFYPSEIACVDEFLKQTGSRNGIAQYWDARYVQNLSRLNLVIAQYSPDLHEINAFTSNKYFVQDYDFAISSANINNQWKISYEKLVSSCGKPKLVKRCGSKVVYVYDKKKLHVH